MIWGVANTYLILTYNIKDTEHFFPFSSAFVNPFTAYDTSEYFVYMSLPIVTVALVSAFKLPK